jgi:hypothetical protein
MRDELVAFRRIMAVALEPEQERRSAKRAPSAGAFFKKMETRNKLKKFQKCLHLFFGLVLELDN